MKRVSILLAEHLAVIRKRIRSALQIAEDMEIAGEVDTVRKLPRLAHDLAPDIVLIDQNLPHGDCLAAIRTIIQSHPSTDIIVMMDHLDDERALSAIEAGATGYILTDIPGANLVTAIRGVGSGRGFPHPAINRTLIGRLSCLVRQRGRERAKNIGLTTREFDTMMQVARGRTDKEIAKRFAVTEATVKRRIRQIVRKLSARSRAQAVARALRKAVSKS